MKKYRLTLVTDGRGDRALIPPITWLLHEKLPGIPIQLEWADLVACPDQKAWLDKSKPLWILSL